MSKKDFTQNKFYHQNYQHFALIHMDFFYMMVNFEVLPFKLYMDGGRIQLYIKEFNITREKNLLENGLVKND